MKDTKLTLAKPIFNREYLNKVRQGRIGPSNAVISKLPNRVKQLARRVHHDFPTGWLLRRYDILLGAFYTS